MKKILALILIFTFFSSVSLAKSPIDIRANIKNEVILGENEPDILSFETDREIVYKDITIPQGALVEAQLFQFQKERRWHKSAFIICKILKYQYNNKIYDISDSDIYITIRKYEKINKKEAAIIATELVVMTGASLFAPGVDIGYFFTKGAIQRRKHINWFKAGVFNAYDNSIFWFIQKGKPIKLTHNDVVKIKHIDKTKAHDIRAKIRYKNENKQFKEEKKLAKAEIKEIKDKLKIEEKYSHDKDLYEQKLTSYEVKSILKELHQEEKLEKAQIKKEQTKLRREVDDIRLALKEEKRLEKIAQKEKMREEKRLAKKMQQEQKNPEVEIYAAGRVLLQDSFYINLDDVKQMQGRVVNENSK